MKIVRLVNWVLSKSLQDFPAFTIDRCSNFSRSQHWNCILSEFWKVPMWKLFHWAEMKVLAELKIAFLSILPSSSFWHLLSSLHFPLHNCSLVQCCPSFFQQALPSIISLFYMTILACYSKEKPWKFSAYINKQNFFQPKRGKK